MKLTHLPKQLVILSFVLSLLVTPLATLLLTPQTAQAVENGKIVYGKNDGNIYSIDPDGSNETQLTSDGMSSYPAIAPDGSSVAYLNIQDDTPYLATVNPDGTENNVTSLLAYFPNWLPDSSRVYAPDLLNDFEYFVVNPDGTEPIQTGFAPSGFQVPNVIEGYASAIVAFISNGSRFIYPDNVEGEILLKIADIDGSNSEALTSVSIGILPTLTPDENTVYFIGSPDSESFYVYSIGIDGTNETQHQQLTLGESESLHYLALSPDGSKLLFVTANDDYTLDMYVMNPDGSNQVLVHSGISGLDNSHGVSWSPDSTKLLFSSGAGESSQDIYTINADGTGLTNLTNTEEESEIVTYTYQSWAPVPGTLDEDSEPGSNSVLTTTVPTTNKTSYLVLPSSTSNASFTATPASTVPTDSNGQYSYPTDLVSFQFDTESPGDTETITLYFDLPGDPSTYTARKYNDITKEFSSIPNASITREDYNNTSMLKLTYQITDGGTLDQDNTTNGTIVDPVGLATTTGSPDTGIQQYWLLSLSG